MRLLNATKRTLNLAPGVRIAPGKEVEVAADAMARPLVVGYMSDKSLVEIGVKPAKQKLTGEKPNA